MTEEVAQEGQSQTQTYRPRESAVVKIAKRDNYIYSGWTIDDYTRFEIEVQGSMTATVWGPKGTLKSSYLLRRGFAIYHDWEVVLDHMVVEPLEFTKLIKDAREKQIRIPLILWDDLNAHLPRTLYFTQRSLYQSMKRNWDLLRPTFSCFMASCVRKDDIISFILKDLDFEVLTTKRRAEKGEDGTFNIAREVNVKVRRWVPYHNPYNRLKVDEQSILVDERPYSMDEVPIEVFRRYWTKRLKVMDQGIELMAKTMEELVKEYDNPAGPPAKPARFKKMNIPAGTV